MLFVENESSIYVMVGYLEGTIGTIRRLIKPGQICTNRTSHIMIKPIIIFSLLYAGGD